MIDGGFGCDCVGVCAVACVVLRGCVFEFVLCCYLCRVLIW